MKSAKRRDTGCELALRSLLHRQGYRFRVDWNLPDTRRRADLAFISLKVAVFIDGCFWHACPVHATWPKANARWWREKLLANRRRDRDTDKRLEEADWLVLRFWEHDDPDTAAKVVARAIRRRQRQLDWSTTKGAHQARRSRPCL